MGWCRTVLYCATTVKPENLFVFATFWTFISIIYCLDWPRNKSILFFWHTLGVWGWYKGQRKTLSKSGKTSCVVDNKTLLSLVCLWKLFFSGKLSDYVEWTVPFCSWTFCCTWVRNQPVFIGSVQHLSSTVGVHHVLDVSLLQPSWVKRLNYLLSRGFLNNCHDTENI